jgi:hypothetical protein
MTSTTNFIQLQRNLREQVKGEYKFQNTQNGTCIITKETADYAAMKSYLQKNDLHYFTFSPNSEKPIKTVICHLPPDMPVENNSNILRLQNKVLRTIGNFPRCTQLSTFPMYKII